MQKIEKLAEHVYGASWFMRIRIRGHVAEISVNLDSSGNEHYKTHTDSTGKDAPTEAEIIQAYKDLF